jgi:phosphatidylserine/phosphatidylglycerophosphate/cardiolipin synthase-like enzyme
MNQALAMVVMAGAVVLLGYFLLTGSDPMGLFSRGEAMPAASAAPRRAGGSDGWWQVFFTDPQRVKDPEDLSDSVAEKLIDHIDRAQHTIHVAAFEFDLLPVAEALVAARERDVEVQWITDDEYGIEADEEEGAGLFAMIRTAGGEVRDDQRAALMHHKFWIFDAQTVWTGSTNITANGSFRNNNNVLVMDSPELAGIYEREFAEMWAGEFGPTSPSTVDDQMVTIDGTTVQVLFSPEDDVMSRLVPLIEGAQDSVAFMAFSFTHDSLGAAMLGRAGAGVEVRGVFETRGSETEYSEMSRLACAGVPVRQDGNPGTLHHKVLVIDGETVVTGSLNFSENADESNDENVVIVSNRDIAAQYLQEFERRWAEAREPDPVDVVCE